MSRAARLARLLCVGAGAASAAACTDADPLAPTEPATEVPLDASLAQTPDPSAHTPFSGGAATVFDVSAEAFAHESPNLNAEALALHEEGDEAFEVEFVPGVSRKRDVPGGLGPVFDNVSCEGCHTGDGRGRPPRPGELFESFLFRISIPGKNAVTGGAVAVAGFGGQLQLRATPGVAPEARATITYSEAAGQFADGTPYSLRVPRYEFYDMYAPLSRRLLFSPRSAPFTFGLGLLEAIPTAAILANEDPRDRNNDGISGRANRVWDAAARQTTVGRFGWKAGAPNLIQQTAAAYNGDMGVTSSLFSAESCEGDRPQCARHAIEVGDETVLAVAHYVQTLGVPARRRLNDAETRQGEAIFYQVGCARCHMPTFVTGSLAGVPSVSAQTIHPYTDLLLHDMGDDLADDRPDFQASGREWRTPPLWGIGLVQKVSGHSNFMHDGRARSLMEAVLWHGGEARNSRDAVLGLSASARAALIKFLGSL